MEKKVISIRDKKDFTLHGIKANKGRNNEIRDYLADGHTVETLKTDTVGDQRIILTDRGDLIYTNVNDHEDVLSKIVNFNKVLYTQIYKWERIAEFILSETDSIITKNYVWLSYDSSDKLYAALNKMGKDVSMIN